MSSAKAGLLQLNLFDRVLDDFVLVVLELTCVVLAHQQQAEESVTFTDRSRN